jgi:hypothetical protein
MISLYTLLYFILRDIVLLNAYYKMLSGQGFAKVYGKQCRKLLQSRRTCDLNNINLFENLFVEKTSLGHNFGAITTIF